MENGNFNLIVKRLGNVLLNRGFKKQNVRSSSENLLDSVFSGQNGSIRISMDFEKKRVNLYISSDLDVHDQTPWTLNSSWLFDPEVDGEREAISISNDFVDLINEGAKKGDSKLSKKRKRDGEANLDSSFFINRLVTYFPEIKPDVDEEKNNYESFRHVTFVKTKVVGAIKDLFEGGDSVKIKRFCKLLNDSYDNGDKDVRSIITIVILNSIEDQQTKQKFFDLLSQELQKIWKAAEKFKGKKIKPEKLKTRKNFISKIMEANK